MAKKKFSLEKLCFLPKKCIYIISYRNEHPVVNAPSFFILKYTYNVLYILLNEAKNNNVMNIIDNLGKKYTL